MSIRKYKTYTSDDEEPEFDSQPDTVEVISATNSIQNALDEGLKNYQRDGYLEKNFNFESNVNQSGSFGVVLKAKFKAIGELSMESEPYAIKKINLETNRLSATLREYEFLSKVEIKDTCFTHPIEMWFEKNVGVDSYSLYIRMEWCEENLRKGMKLLRATYNTSGNRVANRDLAIFNLLIFDEILNAFVSLQSYPNPIIHRDFKPDNVLFSKHGIKLCDFGCGHVDCGQPTQIESTDVKYQIRTLGVGTPLYQAPEQKKNQNASSKPGKYDWRVDMYALGLTLLEMFYETSIDELEQLFNNVGQNRKIPAELECKWPKIAKVILNLTEYNMYKRKSAEQTLIALHEIWDNVIDNNTDHTTLAKKIVGASNVFQSTFDEWRNSIWMMQNSAWTLVDKYGNNSEETFSINNNIPYQSKHTLNLQSFPLSMASLGLRLFENLVNEASIQEISNSIKYTYENKFGYFWNCFICEQIIRDIQYKSSMSVIMWIRDTILIIWRTHQQTIDETFDSVKNLYFVDNKISNESMSEDWIRDFSNQIGQTVLRNATRNDYVTFFTYIRQNIYQNLGEDWSFICGNNFNYAGNTKVKINSDCQSGLQLSIFKAEKNQKLIVDHNLLVTLLHYGKKFINFKKFDKISFTAPITLTELIQIIRPPFPVQIEYSTRGLYAAKRGALRYGLLIDLQSIGQCYIWVSNIAYPKLNIEEKQVISKVVDLIKEESTQPETYFNIPSHICDMMETTFGGIWHCTFADTNYYKYLIYHNGNYFNFVIGELEILLYQPGIISSGESNSTNANQNLDSKLLKIYYRQVLNNVCSVNLFQDQEVLQPMKKCNSCNINNDEGICTICADNCHKGHDVVDKGGRKFSCSCNRVNEGLPTIHGMLCNEIFALKNSWSAKNVQINLNTIMQFINENHNNLVQ